MTSSIIGALDGLDGRTLRGWAFDPRRADAAVELDVVVDGVVVDHIAASEPRHDVAVAGVGSSLCGFALHLGLRFDDGEDHEIAVRLPDVGTDLPGSPIRARFDTGYDPDIVSNLDPIDWRIRGWAYSKSSPEVPVELQVLIDGAEFTRISCDVDRPDLSGTEHPLSCGFDLALPPEIGDGHRHHVDVRVASSGRHLAGAPTIVEHNLIRSPIRPGSLALDTIIAEFGDRSALERLVRDSGRLVLLATHRSSPAPSGDVARLTRALADAGFPVVVVDTSAEPLIPSGRAADSGLRADESVAYTIHRRNSGWDFGSWFAGLGTFEEVLGSVTELLLVNDSNHGPFGELGSMIDRGRALGTSMWGCTESFDTSHHLQSYFLGFQLDDAAREQLMAFARDFDFPIKKSEIIAKGEIGLSTYFREAGLGVAAIHPYGDLVEAFLREADARCDRVAALPTTGATSAVATSLQELLDDLRLRRPRNPTLDFWDVLIARGHPFLKRQLLDANPTGVANLNEVADRLGVDLEAVNRERSLRGVMPVY